MSRSFGITVRTRVGMNELFKENMTKWLQKQPYCAYVYEKEGVDKHIHAQIWLDENRTTGNVKKPIVAMLKRCYMPDEYVVKVAIVIKSAYNDDFCKKYMPKDGELEFNNPPADSEPYYPSKEDQERFQEISKSMANWTIWTDLEGKWDVGTPISEYTVAKFLADEMFVKRSIKVEMDGRKRRQMCETFTAFLTKQDDGTLFLAKDKHQLYAIMSDG